MQHQETEAEQAALAEAEAEDMEFGETAATWRITAEQAGAEVTAAEAEAEVVGEAVPMVPLVLVALVG